MKVIIARNAHQALPKGMDLLETEGLKRESRNGPVVVCAEPVTTVYDKPRERVVYWPERDANPFFHLLEALWMLAGREDVGYVARLVKRMSSYSDDGVKFNGAYGFRWRQHFGYDQLGVIIETLRNNPDDRRCVLQMWDGAKDLGKTSKDLPCNTAAYLSRGVTGRLNMTVTNRSNDVVWGAYGANAVHFSVLQEYIAVGIGCEVGTYYQMSNNFHAYKEVFQEMAGLSRYAKGGPCFYQEGQVEPFPLVSGDFGAWHDDLEMFMSDAPAVGYKDRFFRRVAVPMRDAYFTYKEDRKPMKALEMMRNCEATDWRLAGEQWLLRRIEKLKAKEAI